MGVIQEKQQEIHRLHDADLRADPLGHVERVLLLMRVLLVPRPVVGGARTIVATTYIIQTLTYQGLGRQCTHR